MDQVNCCINWVFDGGGIEYGEKCKNIPSK